VPVNCVNSPNTECMYVVAGLGVENNNNNNNMRKSEIKLLLFNQKRRKIPCYLLRVVIIYENFKWSNHVIATTA
jgi:hypothetical protein